MKGSQGLSDAWETGLLFHFFLLFGDPLSSRPTQALAAVAIGLLFPSWCSGRAVDPVIRAVIGAAVRVRRRHVFLAGRRGGSDKAGHWVSRSVISGVDARGEEGGQELAPTSASGPVQMHYGSPEAAYKATSEELHTRDGGLSVCSGGDRHRRQ